MNKKIWRILSQACEIKIIVQYLKNFYKQIFEKKFKYSSTTPEAFCSNRKKGVIKIEQTLLITD